jgi:Na+-driven multidrug efflux pump
MLTAVDRRRLDGVDTFLQRLKDSPVVDRIIQNNIKAAAVVTMLIVVVVYSHPQQIVYALYRPIQTVSTYPSVACIFEPRQVIYIVLYRILVSSSTARLPVAACVLPTIQRILGNFSHDKTQLRVIVG